MGPWSAASSALGLNDQVRCPFCDYLTRAISENDGTVDLGETIGRQKVLQVKVRETNGGNVGSHA